MLRLRLWECRQCDIRFGVDLGSLTQNGIMLDLAACPVCGDLDSTYEIGALDGYEVPYEPEKDGDA